jgi:hypothetical protein
MGRFNGQHQGVIPGHDLGDRARKLIAERVVTHLSADGKGGVVTCDSASRALAQVCYSNCHTKCCAGVVFFLVHLIFIVFMLI